jgi:hypothetical protein
VSAAAERKRSAFSALYAGHGGCPFRPALDVAQYCEYFLWRRIDGD